MICILLLLQLGADEHLIKNSAPELPLQQGIILPANQQDKASDQTSPE